MRKFASFIFFVITTVISNSGGTAAPSEKGSRKGGTRATMDNLYALLNTTDWIWIYMASRTPLNEYSYLRCLSYRPTNLTNSSVTLNYYVYGDSAGLDLLADAELSYHVKPTMDEKWRDESPSEEDHEGDGLYHSSTEPTLHSEDDADLQKRVMVRRKKLEYWNSTEHCGIFKVRLRGDSEVGPWCEMHILTPALRQAYKEKKSFTACDQAYSKYCKKYGSNVTLMSSSCRTVIEYVPETKESEGSDEIDDSDE
uniref:Putative group i salivary lipocalin n=1 Tax=Rhipicephalus pulchellus TaxID=72859 RepID=L7LRD3_RHIPC